jgi:hypothetical protein
VSEGLQSRECASQMRAAAAASTNLVRVSRACPLHPHQQAQFSAVVDATAAAALLDSETLDGLRAVAAGTAPPTTASGVSSPIASTNGAVPAAAAGATNGAAGGVSGGIGGAGVPAFKAAMAAALKEFFNSADAREVAARCALGVGARARARVCVCVCAHVCACVCWSAWPFCPLHQ